MNTLPWKDLKGEGRIATQVGYSRLAQFELPISGKPEIGGDPGWGPADSLHRKALRFYRRESQRDPSPDRLRRSDPPLSGETTSALRRAPRWEKMRVDARTSFAPQADWPRDPTMHFLGRVELNAIGSAPEERVIRRHVHALALWRGRADRSIGSAQARFTPAAKAIVSLSLGVGLVLAAGAAFAQVRLPPDHCEGALFIAERIKERYDISPRLEASFQRFRQSNCDVGT